MDIIDLKSYAGQDYKYFTDIETFRYHPYKPFAGRHALLNSLSDSGEYVYAKVASLIYYFPPVIGRHIYLGILIEKR